jgi:hypothetical protein
MKVKCIRGSFYAVYAVSNKRLIEGNIYEATQSPYSPDEYLINGTSWFKNRFVVVEGDEEEEATSASVAAVFAKKRYAPNEECPCGLLSKMCDYHRSL